MKKSLLVAAIAALSSFGAFAQGYYFLKTMGTEDAYAMNQSANVTSIIAGTANPQATTLSTAQTFPFANWNFYGSPVTAFKVSTSGYLTFNTSQTTDVTDNVDLVASPNAPLASIFAFWDNTRIQNLTQSGTTYPSDVRSWTYGTAPNRVFVVQWRLVQTNDNTSATNVTYYAIRFYENGKFDIVHNYGFGNFSATVGCKGLTNTDVTQIPGSPTLNFGGADGSYDPSQSIVYTFKYGTQPQYDVTMNRIDIENFLPKGSNLTVGYKFTNNGGAAITSFRINYSVNGGAAVTQDVTGTSIAGSGVGTYEFSHSAPYSLATNGARTFRVWVDNINGANVDLNHSDDTLKKDIYTTNSSVQRKSLHEVFTASTCPPCLPGNQTLQGIWQQRMGGYTVVKYQYSFPGTGDPYFTLEGNDRGTYYGGINTVPRLQVDGKWNANPNDYTTDIFDLFYAKPSVLTITANQTIVDNTITINAKVKPVEALQGTFKIHFAVLEKKTTRNKKTNGETEFYWVMKKMLPDANGTAITFTSDAEQAITKSFTFPGGYRLPSSAINGTTGAYNGINIATENSVEEMSDLIGVVFVQEEVDKEVLQSEWSGNDPWSYYTAVKETSFESTGVTMYPNPAQTQVTINATDVKGTTAVKVLDIAGKEVLTANVQGGMETALDCSALNNGIYFVRITINGNTAVQKLTISK